MHVRLERSDGIFEVLGDASAGLAAQVILGPFEWVQLTYNELRIAPEGDVIATYHVYAREDARGSGWYLTDHWPAALIGSRDREHQFSDIIVYG